MKEVERAEGDTQVDIVEAQIFQAREDQCFSNAFDLIFVAIVSATLALSAPSVPSVHTTQATRMQVFFSKKRGGTSEETERESEGTLSCPKGGSRPRPLSEAEAWGKRAITARLSTIAASSCMPEAGLRVQRVAMVGGFDQTAKKKINQPRENGSAQLAGHKGYTSSEERSCL